MSFMLFMVRIPKNTPKTPVFFLVFIRLARIEVCQNGDNRRERGWERTPNGKEGNRAMLEKSFEIIFHEYNAMITAYLHSLVGDWHEAVDLTQETFVVAYRKMDDFDPNKPLGAWLRGIARNLGRNAIRKKYRHREFLVEGQAIEGLYQALESAERAEGWETRLAALDHCMKALPDKQRTAVDLHYKDGHAASVVARALGILEKSVFQLLWHARNSLKTCVGNLLKSEEATCE